MQISIDEETVKKLAALKVKELVNDFDFLSDEVFTGETAEEVKLSTEEYCRRINDGL
jgi:hypothetical protein